MSNSFTINEHSRSATQRTFDRLKNNFPYGRWLGERNRYARDCVTNIYNECKGSSGQLKRPNQLAEYIAASIPSHCLDGWSFLGKAIVSHSMGDTGGARHFAYYAQLRAVMSILANEGFGVFNKQHFSIESAQSRRSILKGPVTESTHGFTHFQFKAWVTSQSSYDFFDQIISPKGITGRHSRMPSKPTPRQLRLPWQRLRAMLGVVGMI